MQNNRMAVRFKAQGTERLTGSQKTGKKTIGSKTTELSLTGWESRNDERAAAQTLRAAGRQEKTEQMTEVGQQCSGQDVPAIPF